MIYPVETWADRSGPHQPMCNNISVLTPVDSAAAADMPRIETGGLQQQQQHHHQCQLGQ